MEIELVKPKLVETLIDVAHAPTFPFLVIQLKKSNKAQSFVSEVKLSPTLYDLLVKHYGTDRLVTYCDLRSGKIEAWTTDMLISFRILNKLDVMSEPASWIIKSREYISDLLADKKGPALKHSPANKKALDITREILNAGNLLEDIDRRENLTAVARDLIVSGTKDADSVIYRLAMAIYHSKRITDEPAVPKLEDPGEAYLALTGNTEFREKYKFVIDELEKIPAPRRTEAVKTLMSFVIGAYLYNKALLALG